MTAAKSLENSAFSSYSGTCLTAHCESEKSGGAKYLSDTTVGL